MRKLYTAFLLAMLSSATGVLAQDIPITHNPKVETYLSPAKNHKISPVNNPTINPLMNWRINPAKNKDINPNENTKINPQFRPDINPNYNESINPMRKIVLHPMGQSGRLYYLFDKDDELRGYITQPSQEVLLCFALTGEWTCYYILTPEGTYNLFDTSGQWTGNYICKDNNAGFNQFDKDGKWTGMHIK